MRFGAACSNVHDPWFRGCPTIPRAHVFSSTSQPCRNTIPPNGARHFGEYTEAIITATGILREAATRLRNEVIYFPVDVSSDALDAIAGCAATADGANYVTHPPKLERFKGTELRAGDALLLGTDMVKDEATLVRAYDDKDGVTAAFNLNILHLLNRELGANFDWLLPTSGALESCQVTHRDAPWTDPLQWYALTLAGLQ